MYRALLFVTMMPLVGKAQTFTNTGGAIADDGQAYEFDIGVSGLPNAIDTVSFGLTSVCLTAQHGMISDLEISLIAPDGATVILISGSGWTGYFDGLIDYANTCFRNDAVDHLVDGVTPFSGDWRPLQQIDMNNGQDPNGTWKLRIRDEIPDFAGTLQDWSITFGNDPITYAPLISSNLPIVVISTDEEIPNEPKVAATMGIINNPPGVRNGIGDPFTDYDGRIGIELRGNYSLSVPKKSYGIELWNDSDEDTSVALLNMPPESDWVLTANYADKSLLNNALAYHLGRATGNWAPRTQQVELVLNGQYLGTYLFTEKIKRDADRVDIAKLLPTDVSGDELTGGYILKIDREQGNLTGGWNSPYQPPNAFDLETIKFIYDEPAAPVPEQQAYIQDLVTDFENTLAGPSFTDPVIGYRPFIDLRSFIDFMIVNELARNLDAYRASTFLYKDKDSNGGRLTMGPLWDFDLAFFGIDLCEASNTAGWAYNSNYACPTPKMVPFWWWRFLEDPAFTDSLRCRWDALRAGPLHTDTLMALCDTMAVHLNESQQRNFEVWPVLGYLVVPSPLPLPQDHAGEVQELKDWLVQRSAWLDDNWPQNVGGCGQTAIHEGTRDQGIHAYPVPFNDRISITGPFPNNSACTVVLHDATGRIILERTATSSVGAATIDVPSTLAPGPYLLSLRHGTSVRCLRVSKQ